MGRGRRLGDGVRVGLEFALVEAPPAVVGKDGLQRRPAALLGGETAGRAAELEAREIVGGIVAQTQYAI